MAMQLISHALIEEMAKCCGKDLSIAAASRAFVIFCNIIQGHG